jgi:hypothetical protein
MEYSQLPGIAINYIPLHSMFITAREWNLTPNVTDDLLLYMSFILLQKLYRVLLRYVITEWVTLTKCLHHQTRLLKWSKQIPWPLVLKRNIPTELPQLVEEI